MFWGLWPWCWTKLGASRWASDDSRRAPRTRRWTPWSLVERGLETGGKSCICQWDLCRQFDSNGHQRDKRETGPNEERVAVVV